MAKVLCELVIRNKKNAIRTVARSILGPKQRGLIKFYTIGQVTDALAVERNNGIEIETTIPAEVAEKLGLKQETVTKVADTPEVPETEETQVNETEVPSLTREGIIAMGKKEILAYAKENGIELDGVNARSSEEKVTNAALSHFGFETLEESEEA